MAPGTRLPVKTLLVLRLNRRPAVSLGALAACLGALLLAAPEAQPTSYRGDLSGLLSNNLTLKEPFDPVGSAGPWVCLCLPSGLQESPPECPQSTPCTLPAVDGLPWACVLVQGRVRILPLWPQEGGAEDWEPKVLRDTQSRQVG